MRAGRRRWWKRWLAGIAIFLFVIAIILFDRRHQQRVAANAQKAEQAPGVSVVAATARSGNIAVYVDGLGTVVPVSTVTINSRVDGQLMQVLYTEGQLVHQDDLLVQIDPRPFQVQLTQFEGALIRDQALLDNSRIDLERYRVLVARNAVPEQLYTTQKALVQQNEGNVKTDQGQIDSAKLNITYCRITAPITGRLGLRLVDSGNLVSANVTALAVITQVSPITVIFTIGEDQLRAVRQKIQAGARLEVDAYDRAQQTLLAKGSLETIDNQIDPTTGTIRLRAIFSNSSGVLFPNQFVNARLLQEERRNVTLVPNAAIQRNSSTTFVWLVQKNQTVSRQQVQVGAVGAEESEIKSGLSPNDIVVTDGVDRLRDGARVNAQIGGKGGQASQ